MALRDKIKKAGAPRPQSVAPPKMPEVMSEPPAAKAVEPAPAPEEKTPVRTPIREEKPLAKEEPPQTARSSEPRAETVVERPRRSSGPPPPPVPRASSRRAEPPSLPVAEEEERTPLPGPLPEEEDSSEFQRISSSEVIDDTSEPASVPASRNPLADLDLTSLGLEDEPKAADDVPKPADVLAGPEAREEPAAHAPKKEAVEPRQPAPKANKGKKAWAFDAENDEGASTEVVSGYKLKYMDKSASGLQLRLKGKQTQDFELNLDESATFNLDSADGPISVTVKNEGLNSEGKMELALSWEGGVSKAAKAAVKVQKAAAATGRKTVSAIVAHNAEIVIGAIAVAIPVVFYAVGGHQLREAMGTVLYHLGGAGVPGAMAALAIWQGVMRRKDMQAEAGNTPAEAKK